MSDLEQRGLEQIKNFIIAIEKNDTEFVKEKLNSHILNNMYEDHWSKLVYNTLEWNSNRSAYLVRNRITRNKKFIDTVKAQDIKAVKKMIRAKNIDLSYTNFEDEGAIPRTAIEYAAQDNNMSFEIIKILLENDKDCKRINSVLIEASLQGKTEITRYLLDNGADIDYSTYEGTSLYYAVRENDIEMVKLLLQYNPKLDITGENSNTTPFEVSLYLDDMTIHELLEEYSKQANS